jgi:hypothetical protein
MSNERVFELYSQALGNRNSLMYAMSNSLAARQRKLRAQRRLDRLVKIMINRRMFGYYAIRGRE